METVAHELLAEDSAEDGQRELVSMMSRSIQQWGVKDVVRWVESQGYDGNIFQKQKVTGEVLLSLSEKELKEDLGLEILGERKTLMLAIRRLAFHCSAATISLTSSSSPLLNTSPSTTSSPQHSPNTHHYHHYYQHPPSETGPPDATADSGIGGGETSSGGCCCQQKDTQPNNGAAVTPNLVARTLLKQHKENARRAKVRHRYYSSDSSPDTAELNNGTAASDNTDSEVFQDLTKPSFNKRPGRSTMQSASKKEGRPCSPKLLPEYLKTAISCFYMFLVTWITAIVMVFVHDRVPDRDRHPPLPDIFLDNVPHIPWAFQLCEVTIIILTCTMGVILCLHKHRCIILRRFAALSGTVFLLRCATMFITSLSVPGNHLQCSPRERRSVWRQVEQAWLIWQGGGLSIKGVRTCGDYMFSGHTTALTMLNFFITEYTPRRLYYIHICSWVLNMFGVFFVLAAHEHYSIDVFIAFYITSRMFLYYHSLANNRALHQRDSFRTKIWFPMFSYFESNIHGIVPNEYSNLFSLANTRWLCQSLAVPAMWLLSRVKILLVALSGVTGRHDLFYRGGTPSSDGGLTDSGSNNGLEAKSSFQDKYKERDQNISNKESGATCGQQSCKKMD